jgi:ElaB/YqjD/DUF883 family membrane-anchored ribosome-binding protein
MRTATGRKKIQDALELLNEAAQEQKEEVFEMLGSKYESLRGLLEDTVHNGQSVAEDTRKAVRKTLRDEERKIRAVTARLDKDVHRDPWKYLGGAAVGALVLGLILSRKS